MKISINELHNTCKKAFEACGYPYGADDEAASMVSMLEVYGLSGIARLHRTLSEIEQKGFPQTIDHQKSPHGLSVRASEFSMLALGPAIVDLGKTASQSEQTYTINIENVTDPEFLLPVLLQSKNRGATSKLNWVDNDFSYCFQTFNDGTPLFWRSRLKGSNTNCELVFGSRDCNLSSEVDIVCTHDQIKASEQQAIENGVSVDEKSWSDIQKLAKQVFVPESKESKERGAG